MWIIYNSSHLEKTKKIALPLPTVDDNPLEGRIHISGHIRQVFKECIDHVGKIEVSETQAADMVLQMVLEG